MLQVICVSLFRNLYTINLLFGIFMCAHKVGSIIIIIMQITIILLSACACARTSMCHFLILRLHQFNSYSKLVWC